MAACKGCGATVTWLPNFDTAHKAPVDQDSTPTGNVQLVDTSKGTHYRVLNKRQQGEARQAGIDLYTLHFATCPQAADFRRCGTCHKTPCACARAVQGSLL